MTSPAMNVLSEFELPMAADRTGWHDGIILPEMQILVDLSAAISRIEIIQGAGRVSDTFHDSMGKISPKLWSHTYQRQYV